MSHGRDKGCGFLLLLAIIVSLAVNFCDTWGGQVVFVIVALFVCALASGGYHHHHPHYH